MKVLNEMKLSFPSRSANEAFARTALSAFTAALDPTIEELADIKTAVSEAVTNAIVHGYREGIGTIYIHAKILEKNRIVIRIRDTGCGIEDVKRRWNRCIPLAQPASDPGLDLPLWRRLWIK